MTPSFARNASAASASVGVLFGFMGVLLDGRKIVPQGNNNYGDYNNPKVNALIDSNRRIVERHGGFDTWYNCAGVGAYAKLEEISDALLGRAAVSQAAAGAEVLYPSDMMDGRIGVIRDALDAAGYEDTVLVAHSGKLASAFYGPFREAAGSTPAFGDRRSYQLDPANGDEAIREALADVDEGADLIMVKPAGPALDLIRRTKDATRLPIAAYQVSGEYAMIKAGAAAGYVDEGAVMLESLTAIRRAGADVIATYFALDAARALG